MPKIRFKTDWELCNKVQATDLWVNLNERTAQSQSIVSEISKTLEDLIAQQRREQIQGENSQCLCDLNHSSSPDNIARIERDKETLLDDVCEWVFEEKCYTAFTSWDESHLTPCRLLWIKGAAGTGKIMLSMAIIRQISHQPALLEQTLSYSFCEAQGRREVPHNNITAVLRSLMWILLIQQPELIKHLKPDYKLSSKALFEDRNASFAMCRIFKEMLKDARPAYFIVDALDECENGLEDLIKVISVSLTLSNKVRWLVTSRP
jgi:hypothetical protein